MGSGYSSNFMPSPQKRSVNNQLSQKESILSLRDKNAFSDAYASFDKKQRPTKATEQIFEYKEEVNSEEEDYERDEVGANALLSDENELMDDEDDFK